MQYPGAMLSCGGVTFPCVPGHPSGRPLQASLGEKTQWNLWQPTTTCVSSSELLHKQRGGLCEPSVLDMQARALLLNKFAALIEEHAGELAALEALVSHDSDQSTQLLLPHCCRPGLSATSAAGNVMLLGGTGKGALLGARLCVCTQSLTSISTCTAGHCCPSRHANALCQLNLALHRPVLTPVHDA